MTRAEKGRFRTRSPLLFERSVVASHRDYEITAWLQKSYPEHEIRVRFELMPRLVMHTYGQRDVQIILPMGTLILAIKLNRLSSMIYH